ncbi:hypothetical protein DBV15_03839 [Temnothorax longispinosus]|uniref:Odorant receptor n=1 Tax=Temnothorax longispinosus TaxID=300112 RepID=A0A4V3S646_9HYME|nr:hypothetical protein DBV15_03839 [Temnothorax longispinosus]
MGRLNVCNIISIVLFPFVLYIFDTVLRINEYHPTINRLIQMIIPKHFVGRENYYYIIILHSGSTIIIGGIIQVATMTMCVAYIKHACGMFRIASYRIEKAIAVNTLKNVSLENEIIMYREIIHAVDIHRKAIKATALFFSGFQRSRFVLLIIGVLTLSLNLYGVSFSNLLLYRYNVRWYVTPLHVQRLILFLLQNGSKTFRMSLGGVLSLSIELFATYFIYNGRWYVTPVHVQRLILFLLQNGSKTFRVSFGGVLSLSIELFATV